MGVFFAALYLPQGGSKNSFVAKVGVTPYKLLLKVPWVNMQLASSDYTFRDKEKRPLKRNMVNSEAGKIS